MTLSHVGPYSRIAVGICMRNLTSNKIQPRKTQDPKKESESVYPQLFGSDGGSATADDGGVAVGK